MNATPPADLAGSNTPAFSDRPATVLLQERAWLEARKAEILQEIEAINSLLHKRFEPAVREAYKMADKEAGTLSFDAEGVKVKGSIGKRVKWDSAQLRTIAANMTWDQIEHYFKIDFSVPEAVYKAVEPASGLKQALTRARTVEHSNLKITVEAAS